jgi:hypothetical protein
MIAIDPVIFHRGIASLWFNELQEIFRGINGDGPVSLDSQKMFISGYDVISLCFYGTINKFIV